MEQKHPFDHSELAACLTIQSKVGSLEMLFNKVWSITKEIFFGQALFLFKLPKAKLQFLVPILVLISSWGLTDSIQVSFTIKKYTSIFKTLTCVFLNPNYLYLGIILPNQG